MSGLNCDDISNDDLKIILDAHITEIGLVGLHINSYNAFATNGIDQIITRLFAVENSITNERPKAENEPVIKTIRYNVTFTHVNVGKPTKPFVKQGEDNNLYPHKARTEGLNYSAPLYVKFIVTAEAYPEDGGEPLTRKETSSEVKIGHIPVMVGSNRCNLFGLNPEARKKLGEDPNDKGGYFILKSEWVVNMIESRLFNGAHIFHNVGHKNEVVRTEFISKPGDAYENSSELKIRLLTDGGIYFTFSSSPYLSKLNIPFYVIFKLCGMPIEKEIMDNIVYGYDSDDVISNHMTTILKNAFTVTNDKFPGFNKIHNPLVLYDKFVSVVHENYCENNKITDDKNARENARQNIATHILQRIDGILMTQLDYSSEKRHLKLRHLGNIIHDMMLVEMGVKNSTDRDSAKNKRFNTAGQALAKAFKQNFNMSIIQVIKKKLADAFRNTKFSDVNLIKEVVDSIGSNELENALIKSINTGNDEIQIKNTSRPNRLASENLHRKNHLNYLSTERTLRVAATSAVRQDQRADEIRRVHPSVLNIVCPIQSAPTGESVGMIKQLATSTFIVESGISKTLIDILEKDQDLVKLEYLLPETIYRQNLTKVFVNGIWIGCTSNSYHFQYKYKQLRRGYTYDFKTKTYKYEHKYVINKFTTIYWDTSSNKINFWLDAGRSMSPYLVVRNNTQFDPIGQEIIGSKYDIKKNTGFLQDIMLTKNMIMLIAQKKIATRDLHRMGVIEYIAPEELENCLVAESVEHLRKYANDPTMQYTHCIIPQGIIGLPALTCPYADHNLPPRITFQTTQSKQTCGIYALNWHLRNDKHAVVQTMNEFPLAYTLANKYTYPNGMNAITATMPYEGSNQEDSLVINNSATQSGLYKCIVGNFEKIVCESGEELKIPNPSETIDFNNYNNYGALDKNGVIRVGTRVEKGHVLTGKVLVLKDKVDGKSYKDQSLVYNKAEPAVVTDIVSGEDAEKMMFIKVVIFSERNCATGEKFSSRHGQKGMTSQDCNQADLPFTSEGTSPDICMNPHAIPSRMTIGQKIETVISKLNALRGTFSDATIFTKIDPETAGESLEAYGYHSDGTERMYNGLTGEWIDKRIFIGPTYYQRLQKFAVEEVYAISTGPTCAITRQPLDGKAKQGGLRIGEMEHDVLVSQSLGRFIMEKMREDSDYFTIYVCRNCNNRLVVNQQKNIYICKTCEANGSDPDPIAIPGTWTANNLFPNEMAACGIGSKFIPAPYEYESDEE